MRQHHATGGVEVNNTILTCVYCGHAYPEGTPPHGSKVLTDHIAICPKHPMAKLRRALVAMMGVDGKDDLDKMEAFIESNTPDGTDRSAILGAIAALRDTLPEESK